MTRKEAREALFTLVYEMSFYSDSAEDGESLEETAKRLREYRDLDEAYIDQGIAGIIAKREEIDLMISENAIGWKIERLSRISHAIMRLACYEMVYTDLPVRIAINEALELSKKYDHDQAPAFINGVLNSIADKRGLKDGAEIN
ncbi:MAG: transcription antitermination factor NusB [Clostridia bacterium]|nr:transcription antitermination factor NusB [Clostridia bacterium]MBQ9749079.1 transcription antitermination factor NusB [Clostridia bacterium]